jgi:hypothetical protein
MGSAANASHREPWNKGKIVGQKVPFKPKDIWALRVRLQMEGRLRERTMRSPSRRASSHHFGGGLTTTFRFGVTAIGGKVDPFGGEKA